MAAYTIAQQASLLILGAAVSHAKAVQAQQASELHLASSGGCLPPTELFQLCVISAATGPHQAWLQQS